LARNKAFVCARYSVVDPTQHGNPGGDPT
jgi:hypothetical protein